MLLLVLVTFVMTVFELVPALIIGEIVDEPLEGEGSRSRMTALFLLMTTMYVGAALAGVAQTFINQRVGQGVMFDLREALQDHLQRVSVGFFTSTRTGEILSRVSVDTEALNQAITNNLNSFISNLMLLGMAIILMLSINWQLSLIAAGVLLIWVLPIAWVGNFVRRLRERRQEEAADMNAQLEETLSVSGSMLVRAFGRQDFERSRFTQTNAALRDLAIRQMMANRWFQTGTRLFGSIALGVVYWLGSQAVASGSVSIGSVVAFAVLTQRVFTPFSQVARSNIELIGALALFRRIFEYLDVPIEVKERPDARHLDDVHGNVAFHDVSFTYEGAEGATLSDVSFEVGRGETVALVGPSGAGKTTTTYLLQRFFDPEAGSVTIDGHDLRDLQLETITRTIGTVMQDTSLFHASLADNIRYGRLEASDEEVAAAAEAAGLTPVFDQLPDGLDTVVGERGYRLSGGEKQRVAIARVILKDPPILVFDEATSSLDTLLEREIRQAISGLAVGRTTIIIAHRLSTAVNADQIVVFDNGLIVERGTHAELLASQALYARLYNEQQSPSAVDGSGAEITQPQPQS